MPEHNYYDNCEDGDCCGTCYHCTLAICKVCGLFEGALTTDCPGRQVSMEASDEIYGGKLDYKDNKGWCKELNPTNISWLYGAYIRYYGTDMEFAEKRNLDHDYFREILNYWIKNNWKLEKLPRRNND